MDTDGCCGSSAPPESNETLRCGPAKHINPETHLGLEQITLDQGKAIGLGNDRHDVDDLTELLHDNDVDGAQRVACGVDEVQAAVDTCVLDMAVTLRGELLAKVRAVLVLDVFDNRVPAEQHQGDALEWKRRVGCREDAGTGDDITVFVVDLVTVARRVDDVEAKLHTVLDNNCIRNEHWKILALAYGHVPCETG